MKRRDCIQGMAAVATGSLAVMALSGCDAGSGERSRNASSGESVEHRVKKIVADQLGAVPKKLRAKTRFVEDLGADSLDAVELVMAFEHEFNVVIKDDVAVELRTIGDVVEFLEQAASKQ